MKELKEIYLERLEIALNPIANLIEEDLKSSLVDVPHIDRITVRSKSLNSFLNKAEKVEHRNLKYTDPINQIQDQIGARIIIFYLDDVDIVAERLLKYYRRVEEKDLVPESEKEFGYFGKHFILAVHKELHPEGVDKKYIPKFFELQIKTLFQHAFSEASHDLAYKPATQLTSDQKRKIAFTAAQGWGADLIFNELKTELT
jgi:putative GTP pyrophosphokinase